MFAPPLAPSPRELSALPTEGVSFGHFVTYGTLAEGTAIWARSVCTFWSSKKIFAPPLAPSPRELSALPTEGVPFGHFVTYGTLADGTAI